MQKYDLAIIEAGPTGRSVALNVNNFLRQKWKRE